MSRHAENPQMSAMKQSHQLKMSSSGWHYAFSHRLSSDMLSTDMKAVEQEHSVGTPQQHTIALLLHIGHWSVGP